MQNIMAIKNTQLLDTQIICSSDGNCVWKQPALMHCVCNIVYIHNDISFRHVSLIVQRIQLCNPTQIFTTSTALLR